MKHRAQAILLALAILTGQLSAQERLQALVKSGTKYNKIKEYYYVLKDNKTIRDGSYELYVNDYLIESGAITKMARETAYGSVFHRNGSVAFLRSATRRENQSGFSISITGEGIEEWSYDFADGLS